jgi:hypothetical protein
MDEDVPDPGSLEHPDLAQAGASMRAAWREEQEAATRDAVEDWAHRQKFEDRLRTHMHRGDALTVHVAGSRFAGIVDEIGEDLLALRTTDGRVDIHVTPTVPLWVQVTRASKGGHRGSAAAGGQFVHALRARERDPAVQVGTVHEPSGLTGRLVVAADHVVITATAGGELVVPLSGVAWVAPRSGV